MALVSQVTELVPGAFDTELGLEGVEVCVDGEEPGNCAVTDASGRFTLGGLPPMAEILLVCRKDGFRPVLHPLVTPRWSTSFIEAGHVRMASADVMADRIEGLNAALRATGEPEIVLELEQRGGVLFGTTVESLAAASEYRANLVPTSGDGPFFYVFPTEDLLPAIPAGAESHAGTYLNVEPGDYELVFTRGPNPCRWAAGPVSGWRPTSGRENASRIIIRAGHMTWWTVLDCPPEPLDDDAGAL